MKLPVRLLLPQPPEFLIFKLGHTVTVVLSYLQFKFPYPGTHSLGGFYSWASASVSSYSLYLRSDQIRSVAQSCLTLCDPMNRSTPGLPVHHQLPEFTQTHAHRVRDAIQPSHPLSSPSPLAPNPSQHQTLFQ